MAELFQIERAPVGSAALDKNAAKRDCRDGDHEARQPKPAGGAGGNPRRARPGVGQVAQKEDRYPACHDCHDGELGQWRDARIGSTPGEDRPRQEAETPEAMKPVQERPARGPLQLSRLRVFEHVDETGAHPQQEQGEDQLRERAGERRTQQRDADR